MHFLFATVAAAATLSLANADVYMHNPRGSNDRNCERNVNRNNGNRLFDSQNNAKGGYACDRPVAGPEYEANGGDENVMTYYTGSILPIEWTNQHGCGENPDVHCEIVIQYACESDLDPNGDYAFTDGAGKRYTGAPRDGVPRDINDAATDTIPNDANQVKADNVENRRFGMHETRAYYNDCETRERNKGLFAADQKIKRRDARGTRQNPNGNRNGFECPEERDYYPYWHPTPWVDIAVVTSNYQNDKIEYYEANSANRASKGYCQAGTTQEAQQDYTQKKQQRQWYNNPTSCLSKAGLHQWVNVTANGQPFEVVRGQFSRTNHLGNVGPGDDQPGISKDPHFPSGANFNRYYWRIPDRGAQGAKDCVLRIRYNISTSDYDAWKFGDYSKVAWSGEPGTNASYNGKENSPVYQDPKTYFSSTGVAEEKTGTDFLTLALNTNQYGRTFQDRSYTFSIKPRPADVPISANIFNLNVEGKRGNIVQTFPAVEYHFVPDDLATEEGDYLHIQWTGSDYNPRRGCNNGEGGPPDPPNSVEAAKKNSRADRSNMVMMKMGADNTPDYYEHGKTTKKAFDTFFETPEDGRYFAFLNQEADLSKKGLACLTEEQLKQFKNKNQRENHPANCGKLNGATSPYFKGKLVKMTKPGKYTYFSSRNNNFSNRDQTGHVCVSRSGQNDCALNADKYTPVANNVHEKINLTSAQMANAAAQNEAQDSDVIKEETKAHIERENDAEGDGNEQSCEAPLYDNMYSLSLPGALAVGVTGFLLGGFSIGIGYLGLLRKDRGPKYKAVGK